MFLDPSDLLFFLYSSSVWSPRFNLCPYSPSPLSLTISPFLSLSHFSYRIPFSLFLPILFSFPRTARDLLDVRSPSALRVHAVDALKAILSGRLHHTAHSTRCPAPHTIPHHNTPTVFFIIYTVKYAELMASIDAIA
jgi:hypothetical protein